MSRRLLVPMLASLAVLVAAADASAATVTLRCAGRGARNRDSAGTVLCAGSASRGRTIAGVVRDDAGKPVAGRVTVTYAPWIPRGTGYVIQSGRRVELTAKADGSFSFTSRTASKETLYVDLAADPALGIAYGARAQADVSRKLDVTLRKLGGGRVKLTVKGTRHRPLKLYVLDASGYRIPGVGAKNADGAGSATFDLGSRRGQFTSYVDAGVYTDLFWYLGRVRFSL